MNTKNALLLSAGGLAAWLILRASRRPIFSFAERVVLITGGSRGLGLVLARQLTADGARVAICARDEEELQRASDDVGHLGRPPVAVRCDVTREDEVRDCVRKVRSELGSIDVLINNAGIIQVGPISLMRREDFEEALAVNFWGAYNMVDAVLPEMRQRENGRIINICSIGGKISVPHLVPYCVGKFALMGYSQGLRAELANNGVVVTTVCPGLMRTGSPRNAFFKGQNEAEYAWFKISDSLPLLTISAEAASRDILKACERGDAEIVLSIPAKLAVALQQMCPETTSTLISLANRLMPRPADRSDYERRTGQESESRWTKTVFTRLTDEAAVRNNE